MPRRNRYARAHLMGAAKTSLLVTRYSDGAARESAFLDAHQLFLDKLPMTRVQPATAGKTPGLIALRTTGFW